LKWKFIVADTAQKKNNWNDPTDFQAWGYGIDGNIYLLDHLRKRMEAPELRKQAKIFYTKHDTPSVEADDPVLRGMWIEDKSSGIGLIQELKKDRLKIKAIPRSIDKIERAMDAAPYIEAGRVFLNESIRDISFITDEATVFPNGVHDDAIDTTMNAIEVAFIHGLKEIFVG
jgi:predicted phage terminase large subunit-like protein